MFENTLRLLLDSGIIESGEIASLLKGEAMEKIIKSVHPYAITRLPSGDWVTYVKDESRLEGRRKLKRKSKTVLYNFLLDYYNVGNAKSFTLTFSELFQEWVNYKRGFIGTKKKSISQSTIRRYERDYDNYIKGSLLEKEKITDISVIGLEKMIANIISENELKESCARNIIGYISNCFDYAWRSDYIKENIAGKLDKDLLISKCAPDTEKSPQERVLTAKELVLLKKAVLCHEEKHPYYMPDYAVELALMTGMRVGEISALKWENISDEYIIIKLSEHRLDYSDRKCELIIDDTKNHKTRYFPNTDEIRQLLARIKDLGIESEWVFARKSGIRYTAHDISCACDRRAMEAGIKKSSIHAIRRTVSSNLNTVLPRSAVAAMLGHLETTNERFYDYDITEVEEKKRALQKIAIRYSEEDEFVRITA